MITFSIDLWFLTLITGLVIGCIFGYLAGVRR